MSRIVWGSKIPEKEQVGPKQQTLDRFQPAIAKQPGEPPTSKLHNQPQARGQQAPADFFMDGVLVPGNSVYNASPYSRAFVGAWGDHRQQNATYGTTDYDELLLVPFFPQLTQPKNDNQPVTKEPATTSPNATPIPPASFINVADYPHLQCLPPVPPAYIKFNSTSATGGTFHSNALNNGIIKNPYFDPSWRLIFKDCVFYLNSCDADRLVSHYLLEKLIRFMGGVTVMGNSTRVVYVISQHLAANKDEKLKPRARGIGGGSDVSIRKYFSSGAEGVKAELVEPSDNDLGKFHNFPNPQPVRLLAANASIKQSTTNSSVAAVTRANKLLASAARYVHPHFVLACAKLGKRVPSGPYQTMVEQAAFHNDSSSAAASSSINGRRLPLVFSALDEIPIYYENNFRESDHINYRSVSPVVPKAELPSMSDGTIATKRARTMVDKDVEAYGNQRKTIVFELSPPEVNNGATPPPKDMGRSNNDNNKFTVGAKKKPIEVLDLTFTQS